MDVEVEMNVEDVWRWLGGVSADRGRFSRVKKDVEWRTREKWRENEKKKEKEEVKGRGRGRGRMGGRLQGRAGGPRGQDNEEELALERRTRLFSLALPVFCHNLRFLSLPPFSVEVPFSLVSRN